MGRRRTRISQVCNRHAPYRQVDTVGGAATGWFHELALSTLTKLLIPHRPPILPSTGQADMYVCSCKAITESQVRRAGKASRSPQELALALGLDDPACCGRCMADIERIAIIAAESIPEWVPQPAAGR